MAFTQTDLDRLKKAYASGVLSVEYQGRKTTFQSADKLLQAIAHVEASLNPSAARKRTSLAEYDGR